DPQGQGGQRRQFFQLREVLHEGHDVTVCTLAGPQDDGRIRNLARVVRTAPLWRGRVPSLRHRLKLNSLTRRPWDRVVVAHTESWPLFGATALGVRAPVWVDVHNVLGRGRDGSVTPWDEVEADICSRASVVSVCSEAELLRLQ